MRHAIWVESNTEPYQYYQGGDVKKQLADRLATGQIREGLSDCGVFLPVVIAGPNGGHDWDRTPTEEKCINCLRALGELR